MSTQLIDLESGSVATGDSGERADADAIKPIDAGERVQAAVIDRPFENLRARTEELRKKVEELLYRADADKWIITGGNNIGAVTAPGATAFPTVSWNATTGLAAISEAIVVQPFVAPNTDLFGSLTYAFAGGTDTFVFESNDDALASDILYDYQLANSLRIIWETSASLGGDFCVATLEGTPEHILRIVIRNDGTTNAAHVETELNTILAPTIPAATFKFSLTGPGTTFLDLSDIAGREDEYMTNTYSRELHYITKAIFDNFFIGSPLSVDGDGVGIWYEELTDSVAAQHGGRRQATPTTATDVAPNLPPNTEVPGTKLFKFSTEPEKIPGCIPICRRIGTYLVFIDGTVVEHAHTATLGGEGAIDDLLARYVAHIGGSAEKHAASAITSSAYSWISSTNVGAVINEIVDDLASTASGTTRIGGAAIVDTPSGVVLGTLYAQLTEILGHINDRARIASGETISGNWEVTGNTTFDNILWAKSGLMGVHDPSTTLSNSLKGLLGSTAGKGWGFSSSVSNRLDFGGIYNIADICVIKDPRGPSLGTTNRGMLLVCLDLLAGVLMFDTLTLSATGVPTLTLPGGGANYSAMCTDGDNLYILEQIGADSNVYKYSYDSGTNTFTQTWVKTLPTANAFGAYPTNRIKVMDSTYLVILCGNVAENVSGVLYSLAMSNGDPNAGWSVTGAAKGTGGTGTSATAKPAGGLVSLSSHVTATKRVVAFTTGAFAAGGVPGEVHFALCSTGGIPVAPFDAPFEAAGLGIPDRLGAILDVVFDGQSIWGAVGAGYGFKFDTRLDVFVPGGGTAFFGSSKGYVVPFNQGGIPLTPPRLAAGHAGGLATDGFSVFMASGSDAGGGILLSKFPAHGDSHSWYAAEWADLVFPRSERIVSQVTSGYYDKEVGCGRICCDGTHVYIVSNIDVLGSPAKNIVIRVPLYSWMG